MYELQIYRHAQKLVKDVYILLANESRVKNDYAVADQLRRAALSVMLNLAEGSALPAKWFNKYLFIANASAHEVYALLQMIEEIFKIDTQELQREYLYLGKRITSLRKVLMKKINH